jgi:tetratricopeptide (TPR) repeat protein
VKGQPHFLGKGRYLQEDTMKKLYLLLVFIFLVPVIGLSSFQEAYDLYKQGKYYDAEKLLLREKELTPNNLDVYAVLGWCYLNTGRYRLAIEISEEGLQKNSTDTRFLTTIGRSYLEMKRYNDALSYFQKSVALRPDYPYNYYYLGRMYLNQGKLIFADTAFSAAIMLKNDRWVFYKYRGQVYEQMSDWKSAELDYKRALTLKPNDPFLKESLIKVISKQAEQEVQ